MKKIKSLLIWTCLLVSLTVVKGFAQSLPVVLLPELATIHFLSPEPIQYVDISTKSIAGDLPLKNLLRIKRVPDSVKRSGNSILEKSGGPGVIADAIVTITGEKFIAQYRVVYMPASDGRTFPTQIEILPEHMRPLEVQGLTLSKLQMEKLATSLLFKKGEQRISRARAYDIEGRVNHLATFGEYIFIDVGFTNRSNLKYDTESIRFKIEDEKINKASTVQSVELAPEFVLFGNPAFKRNFRNVYVFKKFSYPGHKVLKIELSEKQLSGRVVVLKLKYKELLEADIL